MQHVVFHPRNEQVLQILTVCAFCVELGVIFDSERFLALVDKVHEICLLVRVAGMRIDQLKCLCFLFDLLDLCLLLPEHHLLCLLCLFFLCLDSYTLEELELLVALLELRVDALPHILQVSDDPDAFFHVACSFIFYSSEFDVIMGDGDVA